MALKYVYAVELYLEIATIQTFQRLLYIFIESVLFFISYQCNMNEPMHRVVGLSLYMIKINYKNVQ